MLTQLAGILKGAELFAKLGEFLKKMWTEIKEIGIVKSFFLILVTVGVVIGIYEVIVLPKTVHKAVTEATIQMDEDAKAEHEMLNGLRDKYKPNIDQILHDLIFDLNCDRAFIFEMHNGTDNTSGLPFKYAQMNYEEASPGTRYVCEQYKELNMSNYNLPLYLVKHTFWCGTMDELRKIDPKIAQRIEDMEGKYCAFITIMGVKGELGILGITYICCDEIKKPEKIRNSMTKATQILPSYIDRNLLLNKQ